jgi:uncharacterized membrane protein YidH (DUF202 family)
VTERVWDKGLQSERTALSWRRLSMVFLGIGLLLPRVVWHLWGAWSLIGSGLLAVLAVALYTAGERRYGRTRRSLVAARELPDARLLVVTASAAFALGALALVTLLQGLVS